ncbi:hypothetical protein NKJ59_06065 [Mesorhizobium australicum]|uniref:hypothetical protein n=2 Tax=Mesorhizobium TaxID=68287 RepID=UPI0003FA3453
MIYTIRAGSPADDSTLIRHYRALWESHGVDAANIKGDAEAVTADFIKSGRQNNELATFLAEADGISLGSLACQIQYLPYPDVASSSQDT